MRPAVKQEGNGATEDIKDDATQAAQNMRTQQN